jgi:hypothetical protein
MGLPNTLKNIERDNLLTVLDWYDKIYEIRTLLIIVKM